MIQAWLRENPKPRFFHEYYASCQKKALILPPNQDTACQGGFSSDALNREPDEISGQYPLL